MEKFAEIKPLKIFILLTVGFFIFYSVQISFWTSRADVLTFASRSSADTPILKYAYLNYKSLLGALVLPNYHLGHTIVLWVVYHLMPDRLVSSVWPAGLVSAFSGAFIVGLTFLIWVKLGISKYRSLIISVFTGLIPSIWFHNTFGEIYALQLVSILSFLYFFLSKKYILATIAFLFACLVSPLSGLSFSLILLADWKKEIFIKAFFVGFAALVLYTLIFIAIGSDVLKIFDQLQNEYAGRSFLYRLFILILFLLLNFNFFILFFIKGWKQAQSETKTLFQKLQLALVPQLFLLFLGSTFFIELGSFQIPLFWGLAFPVGLALSNVKLYSPKVILPLLGSIILTIVLWQIPDRIMAIDRHDAGEWLKANRYTKIKVIGDWYSSIAVILERNNWNFKILSDDYFDRSYPSDSDFLATGEDSLIVVCSKKPKLRKLVSKLPIEGFKLNIYNPAKRLKSGKTEKVYENDSVILYKWKKYHPLISKNQI